MSATHDRGLMALCKLAIIREDDPGLTIHDLTSVVLTAGQFFGRISGVGPETYS